MFRNIDYYIYRYYDYIFKNIYRCYDSIFRYYDNSYTPGSNLSTMHRMVTSMLVVLNIYCISSIKSQGFYFICPGL